MPGNSNTRLYGTSTTDISVYLPSLVVKQTPIIGESLCLKGQDYLVK